MSFDGLILLLVLSVVAVYVTPAFIRHRQHQVDNPVEDRFSEGLTLVDISRACPRVFGESARSQPVLLPNSKVDYVLGDGSREMSELKGRALNRRRTMRSADTEKQLVKVREARQARLAAEAVAGRRRFFVAAVALTFVVAFTVASTFGSLNAWWLAAPGALLLGTLISGRVAFQKSMSATQSESLAMRRIRDAAEKERRRRVQARIRSSEVASGSITLGDQQVDLPVVAEVSAPVVDESAVASVVEAEHRAAQDALVGAGAKGVSERETVLSASAQAMLDTDSEVLVSGKSAIVRRRATPLNTAIAGAGAVKSFGSVGESGRRPLQARLMSVDAQSSDEVAAQAVAAQQALDLEQILQQRRAQ